METSNTPTRASSTAGKPRGRPRSFDRNGALEKAMHAFWSRGYEVTSINDLTAAMGLNPPSLYAAFGDKEKLFLEAMELYRAGRGRLQEELMAKEESARIAIERLLQLTAVELTRDDCPRGCMLIMSTTNLRQESDHVHRRMSEVRAETEQGLRLRIERGITEGELPRSVNAGALASYFMTILEGMTLQARDGASEEKLREIGTLAMQAWPVR